MAIYDCFYCKRDLNPYATDVCQYTAGWVLRREGGGGHGIRLPQRKPLFAHDACIERIVKGWAGQASLDLPASEPKPVALPFVPVPTNAGLEEDRLVHVCNVCGGIAPYGIGVALRQGELGQWYCRAHLPPPVERE